MVSDPDGHECHHIISKPIKEPSFYIRGDSKDLQIVSMKEEYLNQNIHPTEKYATN